MTDVMFCTHCGYKGDFKGCCLNCANFNIRNLSTERHCFDWLDLHEDRDKKDNTFINSFTCVTHNTKCGYYYPTCNDFRDKLKADITRG